jgi:hypothetical protein
MLCERTQTLIHSILEINGHFLNITCSFQADLAMEVAPILNIFLFTGIFLAISSNSE